MVSKFLLKIEREPPSFDELIEENDLDTYPIYFLPDVWVEGQKPQLNTQGKNQFSRPKIFFLPKTKAPIVISQEFPRFTFINPSEWSNYYDSVFVILKKIISNLNLDEIFGKFEEKSCSLHSSPFSSLSHSSLKEIPEEEDRKVNYNLQLSRFLVGKKVGYAVVGLLTVGGFFLWGLNKNSVPSQNYSTARGNLENHSLRSDLTIPAKPTLINRSSLMHQIDHHFEKKSQDIQTIALIGIGGAGKTVLARQYARSQNLPVVWEINAETKNSIRSSFEGLAYALSKTDEEQKMLGDLQNIKDTTERERKIIQFVKDHLKSYLNWLLIYDNVENFSDIQKYFPSDPKSWGAGRILITTNDANIQNNRLVNHTLSVKELDGEEKFQLFMGIMYAGKDLSFSLDQKEQAQQFLNFIPPYPLDIAIAAYYLKTTQISYEKYLRYMEAYNTSFEAIQKKMLKVASDYIKTRYHMTALSIEKLIEGSEDTKGILLFISLLDSQNIPKDLLDTYQNSIAVDNFLYGLKEYSLINDESSQDHPTPFISIHRSTQAISLNYLTQTLKLNKDDPLLQKIVDALESYMDKAIIDENDILSLKNHCEVFFSHAPLLKESSKASLRCILGMVYCYLGHYEKSKRLLEENLISLNRDDKENFSILARTLGYLGMVYRILGDFEKAKGFLEQGLVLYRQCKPVNDIKMAWTLQQLGIVYKEIGDYKTAKEFIEEGLTIYRKHFPKNHPQMALTLSTLGIVHKNHGDYKKAKDLLEQSLTIYKEKFSKNHMRIAWVLGHLGENEQEAGNYGKAKDFLEQSLKIYKDHLAENHILSAWALATLGNIYTELDDPAKGKILLEKSLTIYRILFSEGHVEIARIYVTLAKAYIKLKHFEKAKHFLEKALFVYEENSYENHIDLAQALKVFSLFHLYEGDYPVAENYLHQALKIYQRADHPDIYMTLEGLADIYCKNSTEALNQRHGQQSQNFKIQAIKYLKEAKKNVIATFSENSPHAGRIQSKITKLGYK
ncbi:MAG: tetratricopeptide repeat protein [Candidatus Paracaedibacter sp.]